MKKGFVWGVASASYQVEGAAFEDGRGRSVWDDFAERPGKVYSGHTGEVACDQYHRYEEDVAILKRLGIPAYRMSISWSRLLPDGEGAVNQRGIDFYNRLFDSLLANGITPYITLYHWDLPSALFHQGGWMNEKCVDWFRNYARLVVESFSDRVTHYMTFNEPQCFIGMGMGSGEHAPGLTHGARDTLLMAHNVMKAHGAAVLAMREAAKQPIQIGYAPTGTMAYPHDPNSQADIQAAKDYLFRNPDPEAWYWNVPWWSDPVFLGHYPEEGLRLYHPYLPKITQADLDLIHQPLDFMGENIYNGHEVRMGDQGPEYVERYPGFPRTANYWPITPECLYWGPKFLCERYQLPLYITENGLCCADAIALDGQVHDPERIDFLARYLGALKRAVNDGVQVAGYFQWSLSDNFEWAKGYNDRFGLVFVDYRDQRRIIKDSGYWYSKTIQENGAAL